MSRHTYTHDEIVEAFEAAAESADEYAAEDYRDTYILNFLRNRLNIPDEVAR